MNAKAKKIITGVGAMALVATVSITGTLAYLTKSTEKRLNKFTIGEPQMDAMLTEPLWDGISGYYYDNSGKIYPTYGKDQNGKIIWGYKNGELEQPYITVNNQPPTDETLTQEKVTRPSKIKNPNYVSEDETPEESPTITPGYLDATGMRPGTTARKNPIVTNTGDKSEWVAVEVSFVSTAGGNEGMVFESGTFQKIKKIFTIDWGDIQTNLAALDVDPRQGKWYLQEEDFSGDLGTKYSPKMIFIYDKPLAVNDATCALFKSITLNKNATWEEIEDAQTLNFGIYIEGYAAEESAFKNAHDWLYNDFSDSFDSNKQVKKCDGNGILKADATKDNQ